MKSKEHRFLKVELAMLICVTCIWIALAMIDISIVKAAVQGANTTSSATIDVNSKKPKDAKSKQAAQGQVKNFQKTQNDSATSASKKTITPAIVAKPVSSQLQSSHDGASEKAGSPDDRYVEIDVEGRCKIERDRNGNVRSITLGGYSSSDKQKVDQYDNNIQKIKNNAQLTDFEKNKAIRQIHSEMANIQPTENLYNDLADCKRLEITQDRDKQMSQPNTAKEKTTVRVNKELQGTQSEEEDSIIPTNSPIGKRGHGQRDIRGRIDNFRNVSTYNSSGGFTSGYIDKFGNFSANGPSGYTSGYIDKFGNFSANGPSGYTSGYIDKFGNFSANGPSGYTSGYIDKFGNFSANGPSGYTSGYIDKFGNFSANGPGGYTSGYIGK